MLTVSTCSDTSGKIQKGLKELDIKITSVSGVVNDTRLMVADGVKGKQLLMPVCDVNPDHLHRKTSTENYRVVSPSQPGRDSRGCSQET